MIKRSFRTSILISGVLLSGVLAAPAFAQNFGLMPRGACPKISSSSAAVSHPPRAQVQQQPAYDVAYSTEQQAPEPKRPRKRGFPSPF